ncbi:MAG: hypothetical protein M5U01_06805 [Ardenticatenaceae bacterium]|nr:hypothetical protein [Ardenticatenaceae bacterium]
MGDIKPDERIVMQGQRQSDGTFMATAIQIGRGEFGPGTNGPVQGGP